MRNAARGALAATVAVAISGAAMAQTSGQYDYKYPATNYPSQTTQGYPAPAPVYPATGSTVYPTQPAYPSTGTQVYPAQPAYPSTGTQVYPPQPTYPTQPTYPSTGTQVYPTFPTQPVYPYPTQPTAPANPEPAKPRGYVEDTDAWSFNMARYYPAIEACLRNSTISNPVIANVQERRNRTVMLIGQGGSSSYSRCRTGLDGTRVRPGTDTRGLPPAYFAPVGTSFTVSPDRPFQPVVDSDYRLVGWLVRTTPVSVPYGTAGYGAQGRSFDGQYINPVTVSSGKKSGSQ